MAARGSKLSRMVNFFISEDYEECSYVLQRATEIMRKRMASQGQAKDATAKPKRARRTKAQIAAEGPGLSQSAGVSPMERSRSALERIDAQPG